MEKVQYNFKRNCFETIRVSLSTFQEILDIKINSNHKIYVINKTYIEDNWEENRYLQKITLGSFKIVISLFNSEVAMYFKECGQAYCFWSCFEDYSMDEIFEYESRRFSGHSGAECFKIFSQYYKFKRINGYGEAPFSVSQLLYYNKKLFNKELNAICYDVNSSFSYTQTQYLIDTKDLGEGYVGKNQIGFSENNFDFDPNKMYDFEKCCLPENEGEYSKHIFNLIPVSPKIKRFVSKWYNIKAKTTDKVEKAKAKEVLNYSIGASNNYVWCYRALIVGKSNERIVNLIRELRKKYGSEAIIYSNTDSICLNKDIVGDSCKELDRFVGKRLGNFKVEHNGKLKFIDGAYQWENEYPIWRGVPKYKFDRFKERFKHDFDLLDRLDRTRFKLIDNEEAKYILDLEDFKIKLNNRDLIEKNKEILLGYRKKGVDFNA